MDKIGVMLELNCETDFVAKNEEFRQLAKDIAMHIAASNPQYIKSQDVPEEVVEKEKEIYRAQITGNKHHRLLKKLLRENLKNFLKRCVFSNSHLSGNLRKDKRPNY